MALAILDRKQVLYAHIQDFSGQTSINIRLDNTKCKRKGARYASEFTFKKAIDRN